MHQVIKEDNQIVKGSELSFSQGPSGLPRKFDADLW